MIQKIKFENFRNIKSEYVLNEQLNIIFGKNSSGKSNILYGIKLAFSSITGEYCKIVKSDFFNSDDSKKIIITIILKENAIPSLISIKDDGNYECGFKVIVYKSNNSKYIKKITLLNGAPIDIETLREDEKLPNVYEIPFIRMSDLYTDGLIVGISNFIDSEEQYKNLAEDFRKSVKEKLSDKVKKFKVLCSKFNENLDIETSDPR